MTLRAAWNLRRTSGVVAYLLLSVSVAAMKDATECLEHAEECRKMARLDPDEGHRRRLLEMAAMWVSLARHNQGQAFASASRPLDRERDLRA